MKILIIHDPKTERHDSLMKELHSQSIDVYKDVVFIAPVYLSQPKLGISRAHKNCISYAKDKSLEKVIVMENDIHFTHPNSFQFYLDGFKDLPEEWDIYLGGAYTFAKRGFHTENLMKVANFQTLHLYAVNSCFYEGFLSIRDDWHIDTALGYKTRGYLRYPIPSIQNDGYSENFGRYLYHERWTKKLNLYNGNEKNT